LVSSPDRFIEQISLLEKAEGRGTWIKVRTALIIFEFGRIGFEVDPTERPR
jgi:hypothetical protein